MNRTAFVFAAAMTFLLPVFAVDVTDTNIVGASGSPGGHAETIAANGPHSVSGSTLTGGAAVAVTDVQGTDLAYGGNGLQATLFLPFFFNRTVDITNSVFTGGQGAAVTVGNLVKNVDAYGGVGIGTQKGELDLANSSSAYGGTGGTLSANGGAVVVNLDGGDAIYALNGLVSSDGLYAEGGQGGSATTDGVDSASTANGGNGISIDGSTLANSVVNSEVVGGQGGDFDNGTGAAAADGGSGLWATDVSALLMISNATLTGGAGGTVVGAAAGISANGGDGVDISRSTVTILGGTFSGGAAGTNNGVLAEAGYAARFTDVDLTISNDVFFTGRGVVVDSETSGNDIKITGGTFSAIEFGGDSVIDISGGTFESDLLFTGTGTQELSIVSAETTGGVTVRETQLTVTGWDQEVFKNTTVANGTINFNNQVFALGPDSSFVLESQNAAANFNDGLSINSGTLDVGLGTVTASVFNAQSGSTLKTTYNGVANGVIKGGTLTFESGVAWTINGGTNDVSVGQEFVVAEYTSGLTSALLASNFTYVGTSLSWLEGITDVIDTGNSLNAVAGTFALDEALAVDPNSKLGKVVADLVKPGVLGAAQLDFLKDIESRDEAEQLLAAGFLKTPEMANVLVGRMPGVVSGQILGRTGSFRRNNGLGNGMTYSPVGAGGPETWYDDAKLWMDMHLPSLDGRSGIKKMDAAAPRPNLMRDDRGVSAPYVAEQKKPGSGFYGALTGWLDRHTPKWDARDTVKRVDERAPRLDLAEGNSGPYAAFKEWLSGLLPEAAVDGVEIPPSYQVWGRGYGSWIEQKTTGGFAGYDANIAGGIMGADKRFNNLLLGVGGGYAHTQLKGKSGDDGEADTGYGVAYAAITGGSAFLDVNLSYAFNSVETEMSSLGTSADYNAHSVSAYVGGGMGLSLGDTLLFTPEASILSTYYKRDSYTETGFGAKKWDAYDQWSYLGSLGGTLSMTRRIDSFNLAMAFRPELRAHWLHDFNADMDETTYTLAGGANSINVDLQAREEDLLKLGAGIRFSSWESETLEFGVDFDATFGEDYKAYVLSGKLLHRF